MKQARYEVKFLTTEPEPKYIECWWTYDQRDRVLTSMRELGWTIVRVTRLFQAGVREV